MNEERLLLALYDRWCLVMNGDEAALRILRANRRLENRDPSPPEVVR